MMAAQSTLHDLRRVIQTYPLLDNHAHNLLKPEYALGSADHPFESITSEAQKLALTDCVHFTLAHQRAVKQLSELFQCPPAWDDVKKARDDFVKKDYGGLIRKCLEGTHMILVDDGLDAKQVEPYNWHDQFTPGKNHRIVRIEAMAADLVESLYTSRWTPFDPNKVVDYLQEFNEQFEMHIKGSLYDREVAGFKSVICYRTGLNVNMKRHAADVIQAFRKYLDLSAAHGNYRIKEKALNDHLVITACCIIEQHVGGTKQLKPIQFHTGLGDSDIDLVTSNPAHMQPLIEFFPKVDFVLLHSSYPYTREAGYLASAFLNVYMDIGEVFPMLSREGQETVIRQTLELVPTNKIFWSTDGHFFPETYWLANKQFRSALEEVLTKGVMNRDFDTDYAIDAARKIMFHNANHVYQLLQDPEADHLPPPHPSVLNPGSVPFIPSSATKISYAAPSSATVSGASMMSVDMASSQDGSVTTNPSLSNNPMPAIPALPSTNRLPPIPESTKLDVFLTANPDIKYIWTQWVDYTSTVRLRMLTVSEFLSKLRSQKRVGITLGVMYLLQDDTMAENASATGQIYLEPDLSSLCRNVGLNSKSATVMNFWRQEDGGQLEGCPRTTLHNVVKALREEYDITLLLGFEIEILFVRLSRSESGDVSFSPWHTTHSWSNMTLQQLEGLDMIEKMVESLAEAGIYVQQFHAESAPGQWEFVLPPLPPLQAVDTLIKARQTLAYVAKNHGLHATLYPRPYPMTAGTAAHAHISVSPEKYEEPFFAEVLEHLPAALAFTLPQEASYERVVSGVWSGGEWVAWGTQNRETPLRKIETAHWELKCVDGLANMYFAMAAIIASGLWGVRWNSLMTLKDCPAADVSQLTDAERQSYGIKRRLPKSLDEALAALEADDKLRGLLGNDFAKKYIGVKRAEQAKLRAMPEEQRRSWLIDRY